MTNAKELTDERHNTHGDWLEQSMTAQMLKATVHARLKNVNKKLPSAQAEALDMICVKISRIINGNETEPDHWDDIIGYAHLGKPKGINGTLGHEGKIAKPNFEKELKDATEVSIQETDIKDHKK